MKTLLKTLVASSMLITFTQLPISAAPKPSCWDKTRSCFRCCMKEVVDHSDTILAIAQAVLPFPEAQAILSSIQKIKNTSVMQALVIACKTDAVQPVAEDILAQLKTANFPINADGTISANVKAFVNAAVLHSEIPASNAEPTRSSSPFTFTVLNEEQLLNLYEVKK